MELEEKGKSIDLVLTEDESFWYFNISSDKINNLPPSQYYILNKVVISMPGTNIYKDENKIVLSINK